MPLSRIKMDLIKAARPLQPSKWPMLALTDPLQALSVRKQVARMIDGRDFSHVKWFFSRAAFLKDSMKGLDLGRVSNLRSRPYKVI